MIWSGVCRLLLAMSWSSFAPSWATDSHNRWTTTGGSAHHGLVRRDDEGRFTLGLRLVALGHAAGEAYPLAEAARPALRRLRDETGESVQLYVRRDDQRVCIVSMESPHGLRTIVALGAVLPLDRGSAGAVLRGAEEQTRKGWAQSVGEREAGVASVSAPCVTRRGPSSPRSASRGPSNG